MRCCAGNNIKKKKNETKKISVIAFLDDGSKSSRSHSQHTGGKAIAGTCVICKLSSFHLFIASSFYSFSNIKVFFFFVIVVVFLIPGYEVASPGFFFCLNPKPTRPTAYFCIL